MTRLALLLGVALTLGGTACNKPEADDCRKALENMQHLLGTETLSKNEGIEGDVRRCRGASSKEAVQCTIKATTIDELNKCDFMKAKLRTGSDAKPDDKKPDDKKPDDDKK